MRAAKPHPSHLSGKCVNQDLIAIGLLLVGSEGFDAGQLSRLSSRQRHRFRAGSEYDVVIVCEFYNVMDKLWKFGDFILNEMDVAFGVPGESTRSPSPRVVVADIERLPMMKGRESTVRGSTGVLPRFHSSTIDRLSPGKPS